MKLQAVTVTMCVRDKEVPWRYQVWPVAQPAHLNRLRPRNGALRCAVRTTTPRSSVAIKCGARQWRARERHKAQRWKLKTEKEQENTYASLHDACSSLYGHQQSRSCCCCCCFFESGFDIFPSYITRTRQPFSQVCARVGLALVRRTPVKRKGEKAGAR